MRICEARASQLVSAPADLVGTGVTALDPPPSLVRLSVARHRRNGINRHRLRFIVETPEKRTPSQPRVSKGHC